MLFRRKKELNDDTGEREVFTFYEPGEWEAESDEESASFSRAEADGGEDELQELLRDYDSEVGNDKYVSIIDPDENEPSSDDMSGDGKDGGDDVFTGDLVSAHDPVIAAIEQEARQKAEEERRNAALKSMTRRQRRVLEYEKKAEEQERLNEAKNRASGRIESERQRIEKEREAEAEREEAEEEARREMARRKRRAAARKKRRRSPVLSFFLSLLGIAASLAAVIVLIPLVMGILGRSELVNSRVAKAAHWLPADMNISGNEDGDITYSGTEYTFDERTTNILVMLFDGTVRPHGKISTAFVLSRNMGSGLTDVINFPLEAATEQDVMCEDGALIPAGTTLEGVWGMSTDKKKASEMMASAASHFMFGLPVNAYIAIDTACLAPMAEALEMEDHSALPSNGEEFVGYVNGITSAVKERMRRNPLLPFYLLRYLRDSSVTSLNPTRLTYILYVLGSGGIYERYILDMPVTHPAAEGAPLRMKQKTWCLGVLRSLYE